MTKRIIALIVAPIIGAVLGYFLADVINNGWLSSRWQKVESPPGNVHRLIAVNKGGIWIESDSGTFYYNENPSSCQHECWREVSEIPDLPIVEPHELSVTDIPCAPLPPLVSVKSKISECRKEAWIDRNSTFALRNDGSIYLWQVNLASEWSAMLMILTVCTGAIALFVLTLIVVLFSWLLDHIRKKQRESLSTAL
jgi:phosphate/sulfate permease